MSLDLQNPTEAVENIRLPTLRNLFRGKYGEEWYDLEDETISLDIGLRLTPLLIDKINLLRILELAPEMAYDNLVFLLHAADVFSNIATDFDTFPMPNSLQLAWAAKELRNLVDGEFSDDIKIGVTSILLNEGYSSAPGPLLEICFPDKLVPGQEIEDRQAKEEAVRKYIEHMESSK